MSSQQVQKMEPVENHPVPTNETAAILQVIERAATNPDVDIDKMERLFSMHERMKQREAERAFADAMAAAQAEMPVVVRNLRNNQTNSRYADIAAIAKAVNPIITKHGFSLSFGTDASRLDDHYCITCTVSHEGGHSKHYQADIPADGTGMKGNANKTATHAFGSTMSYGRRYLTLLIFNIATGDDDDGNRAGAGPVITDSQRDELLHRS
jgi:hypothetical protein